MTRYFNTKEAAERHLEYRKKCAIKGIEKRGDKIVRDNSFVYQDYIWSKYDEKTHSVTQTNTIKWFTFLELVTYNMIMDLLQMIIFCLTIVFVIVGVVVLSNTD